MVAVRACEMDVISNMALNMCRSSYLIILYLLKDEHGDLESKFFG